MLRQQGEQPSGKPNRSLADFVAPIGSGVEDWIGAFAVTAGIGAAELANRYERDGDDYHAIMVNGFNIYLLELLGLYFGAAVLVLCCGPGRFSADELIVRKLAPGAREQAAKLEGLLGSTPEPEYQN